MHQKSLVIYLKNAFILRQKKTKARQKLCCNLKMNYLSLVHSTKQVNLFSLLLSSWTINACLVIYVKKAFYSRKKGPIKTNISSSKYFSHNQEVVKKFLRKCQVPIFWQGALFRCKGGPPVCE